MSPLFRMIFKSRVISQIGCTKEFFLSYGDPDFALVLLFDLDLDFEFDLD